MPEPSPFISLVGGCDVIDWDTVVEHALAEVLAEDAAEIDLWLMGNGTGEVRGVASWTECEPTPVERAFAILDPHLRACPLYDAGPPAVYPMSWKAAL